MRALRSRTLEKPYGTIGIALMKRDGQHGVTSDPIVLDATSFMMTVQLTFGRVATGFRIVTISVWETFLDTPFLECHSRIIRTFIRVEFWILCIVGQWKDVFLRITRIYDSVHDSGFWLKDGFNGKNKP